MEVFNGDISGMERSDIRENGNADYELLEKADVVFDKALAEYDDVLASEMTVNGEKIGIEDSGDIKQHEGTSEISVLINPDEMGNLNIDYSRTPESNGHWDGERGDSTWIPDGDYTPPGKGKDTDTPYNNPDDLSWSEICGKYGIDGIPFENGYPVFSEISKGTIEIDGFETGGNVAKTHNFSKADIAMAEQHGCTPEEVREWRKENNYTWHECEDKKTMQKVPNEVHANIPHDGGRSQE